MLSDLGLHELADISGLDGRAREDPATESSLAYALLSACIVYEGVWALYLGRPSSVPKSTMNIAALRCKAQLKSDSPLLNAWLGLCVPMAEISHILNDKCTGESDASASLPKFISQMQHWYDNLPDELVYNETRLTNLSMAGYGLHTQYCKVQILLRRALARCPNPGKRKFSQISSNELSETLPDDLDRTVYRYSLRIARLVVTYREVFGVEKIPSIMLDNAIVAATAMVDHTNNTGSTGHVQQDPNWVNLLVKSMEAVEPHFPIIRRMLDSLNQVSNDQSIFDMGRSASPQMANSITSKVTTGDPLQNCSSELNAYRHFSHGTVADTDDMCATFNMNILPGAFFWAGVDDIFTELVSTGGLMSDLPRAVFS